jgi:molybdopterin molybdotransferase
MAGELIEFEQARRLVLERCKPLEAEEVDLEQALGRVLAADVSSSEQVPGFDNSAMDGFAVRAADTGAASPGSPARLALIDESRAGSPAGRRLGDGEAIAISTGAMLPAGADAVVRVEDTEPRDGVVEVLAEVEQGRDVRRAGEDIRRGETVLRAGTALGPAELGVLASVGAQPVSCARRPRVSVVLSGDELVGPQEPLGPGKVRDSNAFTVPALAQACGAEVLGSEKVGDDAAATREAIGRALGADLVAISGGMSVGEHDHVRPALAELGAEQVFWGVAIRPGRPTWFGVHPGGSLVIGLPGNPVSAVVCFLLLARPAILAMQGLSPERHRTRAVLDAGYQKRPGRMHAVRCTLELRDDGWHARPTGEQGSHILTSMVGADALALIPAASGSVEAGETVEIELLPRS